MLQNTSNIYTTPLKGKPLYSSKGIIKAYDCYQRFYSVGEIIFERFDEKNYQYIIKPYWDLINYIPEGIFQGIPGIDLDLGLEAYYRVNMVPSFIEMRTPSVNREDIKELMATVKLNYYDSFEWLLRTESYCGDDNLLVIRDHVGKELAVKNIDLKHLIAADTVIFPSLSYISTSNGNLISKTLQILQSGARIEIKDEQRLIGEQERNTMCYLLCKITENYNRNILISRQEGREKAKKEGQYKGRKPINMDENLLKETYHDFKNKKITESEAMKQLGLISRSTFYRKLKTVRGL